MIRLDSLDSSKDGQKADGQGGQPRQDEGGLRKSKISYDHGNDEKHGQEEKERLNESATRMDCAAEGLGLEGARSPRMRRN